MAEHPKDLIAVGEITNNHRDSDGSCIFLREALGEEHELVRGLLHEGQEDGTFRNFDLEVTSTAIEGATEAVLNRWAQGQTGDLVREPARDLTADADELIQFVYRAIHT